MSAEERIKSDTQKSEAAVGILPRRGIAATRGSKPSDSISKCGRMIQLHGGIPTDWDRVIVMGLVASQKCSWR